MPFVPTPNVVQVDLLYQQQLELTQNTLYFKFDAGVTQPDCDALGDLIISVWSAEVRPNVSQSFILRALQFTDQTSLTGLGYTYAVGLPLAGARIGDCYANNCAVSMKFDTALRGKSYQGRIYMAGFLENDVSDNRVASSWLTAMTSAFTTIRVNAFGDAGAKQVVVSRRHNNAWRSQGVATEVNSTVFVDPTIDSQRRRLPGRGK